MRILKGKDRFHRDAYSDGGFTLIEVMIAGGIMIILCIGTLTVFSHATKINSGNNLRAQAQSVLQKRAEYYRGLKFIPVGSDTALNGTVEVNVGTETSADMQVFVIYLTIDNDPVTSGVQTTGNDTTKFKEIKIRAVPQAAQTGWLNTLNTELTIQRVRGN